MSSPDKTDWRFLVRYLTGEHASNEEKSLQAWILESEERARLMDELGQVWDATEKPPAPRDMEAAWQKIGAKIEKGDAEASGEERAPATPAKEQTSAPNQRARPGRAPRRRTRRWPFLRGAAVVAMVAAAVLLTALLLREGPFASPAEEARVFTTKRGQRAIVHLSDGTLVRLNVDSRLTLPTSFSAGTEREVRLEGEAYFEVVRDAERPFLVRTRGATVRVLGTAFDVRAYADEEKVQVAVAEGEVALGPEASPEHAEASASEAQALEARPDTVLLRSRHLGVVAGRHVQAVRQGVDLSRQLAWTEGQLVFEDAPFSEVVRQLERWYDVQVEASRVAPQDVDQLNAIFDDEPLEETLKAVAAALDLQYRRAGRLVTFYPRGKAPLRDALSKK